MLEHHCSVFQYIPGGQNSVNVVWKAHDTFGFIDYAIFLNTDNAATAYYQIRFLLSGGLVAFNTGTIANINIPGWNHVVVTWNETTKYLDVYSNNTRIYHTQYLGQSRKSIGLTYIQIGEMQVFGSGTCYVDEVCVVDKYWDTPEVSLDYNGGAGRTFPF